MDVNFTITCGETWSAAAGDGGGGGGGVGFRSVESVIVVSLWRSSTPSSTRLLRGVSYWCGEAVTRLSVWV